MIHFVTVATHDDQIYKKIIGGSCRRVHNLDFNSASNILFIAKKVIGREGRPKVFSRTFQACAFPVGGDIDKPSQIPC